MDAAAPDVFHPARRGRHAFVAIEGELTAEQLEHARQAELGCPERAITIEE